MIGALGSCSCDGGVGGFARCTRLTMFGRCTRLTMFGRCARLTMFGRCGGLTMRFTHSSVVSSLYAAKRSAVGLAGKVARRAFRSGWTVVGLTP
jgi:hypothetical protein